MPRLPLTQSNGRGSRTIPEPRRRTAPSPPLQSHTVTPTLTNPCAGSRCPFVQVCQVGAPGRGPKRRAASTMERNRIGAYPNNGSPSTGGLLLHQKGACPSTDHLFLRV